MLFVVGQEHNNYEANLRIATRLNDLIKKEYPSITRGRITKKGSNVNGIYNQDVSPNALLIEIGGYQNKIDEVLNTVEIIAENLKEIINEDQKTK